ncbi:MAG: EamA family transporter [Desulfocucumaceae bacterium]
MLYYFAISLTIFANIFYHISQKSTPGNVNPIISLIVAYLTATIFCLVILPFYPSEMRLLESIKQINWASFALGLSIVGLEAGFLLAYRAGWSISTAAIFSNAAVMLLLIPVGIFFFGERLSPVNAAGIVLCVSGLVLINSR